jgi:hypothetical protein
MTRSDISPCRSMSEKPSSNRAATGHLRVADRPSLVSRYNRPYARGQRRRGHHDRALLGDDWADAGGRETDACGIAGPSRSGADGGILPWPTALLALRVSAAAQGCAHPAPAVAVRNGGGSFPALCALSVCGDLPSYAQHSARSPRSCPTDARPNTSVWLPRWDLCCPTAVPGHCCRSSCRSRTSRRLRQPAAAPRA